MPGERNISGHYQPRKFPRNVSNRPLQECFTRRGVLAESGLGAIPETPIYEAWLQLPERTWAESEQDFQEIDELAREGGSKAIIDEANWHGEDLAEQFAALHSLHARAF